MWCKHSPAVSSMARKHGAGKERMRGGDNVFKKFPQLCHLLSWGPGINCFDYSVPKFPYQQNRHRIEILISQVHYED